MAAHWHLRIDPACIALSVISFSGSQTHEKSLSVQDRGFEIVASFGDQFSDLAGTSAGRASFKLPNPMYYIL